MLSSHPHAHDHGHRDHSHHGHPHSHAPAAPHPPQVIVWSILRMPVMARLTAAAAVSAVLWALVYLAMK